MDPDIVSVIIRCGSITNPASLISFIWGFFAHRRENFDDLAEIRAMPYFAEEN
jgi:hypothetical protein